MLRAGVFSPCPFQQHWVGDRLSPVASITKVRELRFALFNFCFLYSGRMMLYAFSCMEHSLGEVQSHSDISLFSSSFLASFQPLSYPSIFLSFTFNASLLMFSVSCTSIASEIWMRRIRVNYIFHMHWIWKVSLRNSIFENISTCSFLSNFQEWLHELIHEHVICNLNIAKISGLDFHANYLFNWELELHI